MEKKVQELLKEIKACDTSKPFAFVSYSKLDSERIYPVIIKLQKDGYNLWIDKELKTAVGMDWRKKALDAIAHPNCKELLFFMSGNSIISPPVCTELFRTKSKKVRRNNIGKDLKIIPILLIDKEKELRNLNFMEWIDEIAQNGYGCSLKPSEQENFVGVLEKKYLVGGDEEIDNHGEIAMVIKEEILEPLGGSKITCAELNDIDTIENTRIQNAENLEIQNIIREKRCISPAKEAWNEQCKAYWDKVISLLFEKKICAEFDSVKVNQPIGMPKDCCALRLHSSKIRVEWFVNKKSIRTALIIKRDSDIFNSFVEMKDYIHRNLEQIEGDIIWNLEVSNASVSISKNISGIENSDRNELAMWYGKTASVLYEAAMQIIK